MNLDYLDFEQPIAELESKIDELRLVGNDSDINIKTTKPEFLEWKWIDLDMITEVVVDFKLHVYQELKEKIKKIIN